MSVALIRRVDYTNSICFALSAVETVRENRHIGWCEGYWITILLFIPIWISGHDYYEDVDVQKRIQSNIKGKLFPGDTACILSKIKHRMYRLHGCKRLTDLIRSEPALLDSAEGLSLLPGYSSQGSLSVIRLHPA